MAWLVLVLYCKFSHGQSSISIVATWGQESVELNNPLNDTIEFNTVKFYLSNINLYNKFTEKSFTPQQHTYLVDFSDSQTTLLSLPDSFEYTHIKFTMGIDSLTQCQGALSGILDPLNGMYWTWQTGYINVKLEGSISNKEFIYHLGGFIYPYNASRQIILECQGDVIYLDLKSILNSDQLKIMRPCSEASDLSSELAKSFRCQ